MPLRPSPRSDFTFPLVRIPTTPFELLPSLSSPSQPTDLLYRTAHCPARHLCGPILPSKRTWAVQPRQTLVSNRARLGALDRLPVDRLLPPGAQSRQFKDIKLRPHRRRHCLRLYVRFLGRQRPHMVSRPSQTARRCAAFS